MRFTDLNTTSPTRTNPGDGVLSVNASGDVIYVEANNAPAIGNYCPAPQNPLTNNFEIPLNDFNYYFTGQGTNPDSNNIGSSVAIGLNCGVPVPLAKLHVLQSVSNPFPAAPFFNNDLGIAGFFENDASGSITVGVFATSYGEAELNVGGAFHATSTHTNAAQSTLGVTGIAENGMDENTGVMGEARGGDFNFGVHGMAGQGTTNYAVFGELEDTTTIGSNDFAGYFVGPVHSTHMITQGSDVKLKRNIKDLSSNNALALISKLNPKSYEYSTADYPSMRLPKGNQYGLIAQEVETVLPELVKEAIHPPKRDKQGKIIYPKVEYLAVNYTGFIPVLIGAVKEQQHTIDSLKEVINERLTLLENRLNGCCNAHNYKTDPNEGSNRQTVELSNLQSIILDQNVPNPFAEQTSISYFIPDDAKNPQIIFFDMAGRVIKSMTIEKGAGTVTVYAQTLSSGTYKYALLIDGKTIEVKTMMKSR